MNMEQREQLYQALEKAAELLAQAVKRLFEVVQEIVGKISAHGSDALQELADALSQQLRPIDFEEDVIVLQDQRLLARQYEHKERTRYMNQMKRFHNYEKPWKAWKGQRR